MSHPDSDPMRPFTVLLHVAIGTAFWTMEEYKTSPGCKVSFNARVSHLSSRHLILPNISSAAMSSTTSLIPSKSKSKQSDQKDWAAAFATLSSKYGFGGMAPSLPQSPSKPSDAPAHSPPVKKTQPLTGYELAFGQLASSYGFNEAVGTSTSKVI